MTSEGAWLEFPEQQFQKVAPATEKACAYWMTKIEKKAAVILLTLTNPNIVLSVTGANDNSHKDWCQESTLQ